MNFSQKEKSEKLLNRAKIRIFLIPDESVFSLYCIIFPLNLYINCALLNNSNQQVCLLIKQN